MGPAVVAYTDPQGVFGRHDRSIEKHLQYLTNIHWRPPSVNLEQINPFTSADSAYDTTMRTVPQLKIQLIPEGSRQQKKQHQVPGLNSTPYVQVFVIETAPLEIYRSKLRQIGKDWFQNQVEVREPTGYVVVQAVSPEDTTKSVKAIWSRLTTEFDPINCIQLDPSKEESWVQLRLHIQKQLIAAFDARVSSLESEIRKLQATRSLPGWNFGALFAVYESLAWALESMNLLDDALNVYNLLEVMVADRPPDTWAAKPQTLNLGIVDDRDAIIEPVLSQTASIFDIKRHLLSRKVSIMLALALSKRLKDEKADSLADKYVLECVRMFLGRIPALIRVLVDASNEEIAHLWLLKAARELFVMITEAGSPKYAHGSGEVLLLERDAIQKLGALKGWRIPGIFTEIPLQTEYETEPETKDADEISKASKELKGIFKFANEGDYVEEFKRLTLQSIGYHRTSNAQRVITRLLAQLLQIEFSQQHFSTAWEILERNPSLLKAPPKQKPLETVLEIALSCAEKLDLEDNANDLTWRIIGLGSDVSLKLFQRAVNRANKMQYKSDAPQRFDLGIWFEPKINRYLSGDENGYYIQLELVPKRPDYPFVSLENAKIDAVLCGSTGDTSTGVMVSFETAVVALGQKNNFYTKTFREGLYELAELQLHHGPYTFFHKVSPGTVVAMRPLSTAFTGNVMLAKKYSMSKRNIEINVTSPSKVGSANIQIETNDEFQRLIWDEAQGLDTLSDFTSAVIKIPILVNSEHPRVVLRVIINYDGRSYEFSKELDFTLAISVDFQEYFRQPPRILSQFLVKPFTGSPIVFTKAELLSSSKYAVDNLSVSKNEEHLIAYSGAPISYVFGVEKRRQIESGPNELMVLKLTYRSLLWECQKLLYTSCLPLLEAENLGAYSPLLSQMVELLGNHFDIAHYATCGEVTLVGNYVISRYIKDHFQLMNPADMKVIANILSSQLEKGIAKPETLNFDDLNSVITLDVPDPDAKIIHYVELNILYENDNSGAPEKGDHVVGGIIPACLTIETRSFLDEDLSQYEFEYELDRLSEGWSYTGKVKGCFEGTARVEEQISLIPNRSGELLLPNVMIRHATQKDFRSDNDSESEINATSEEFNDAVIVAKHANTRILVVPDMNMLAITF